MSREVRPLPSGKGCILTNSACVYAASSIGLYFDGFSIKA